ncbi:hypothetical protein LXL04_035354 [Taraxacum kok-saghyz]
MDQPADHPTPNGLDWFHYFDQYDDPPVLRVDMLEHQCKLPEKLHDVLNQNISPLTKDENIIAKNWFEDFDPFEDLSLWACWGDDSPLLVNNEDSSESHLEANYYSTFGVTTEQLEFQDFNLTCIEDLSLWDCWDNELPLHSFNDDSSECRGEATSRSGSATTDHGGRKVAKRSRPLLELEEIEKYFEMPIVMAAKELNIGLTLLKKRCRDLNIKRWPHRKLKSLQSLIQNVKELGLEEEIEMLERQKRMMEKSPEIVFTEKTRKLRQACFKANYKKRRLTSPP